MDTAERLEGAIDLIFEKVGILYTCHLTGGEKNNKNYVAMVWGMQKNVSNMW